MKKRKGNIMFSMLLSISVFMLAFSMLSMAVNSKQKAADMSQTCFNTYTYSSCLDVGLSGLLNDICAVKVIYPKTPLNNSVFIYDEAIKSIFDKVLGHELIYKNDNLSVLIDGGAINNEEIKRELSQKSKDTDFKLEIKEDGLFGDFQHADNVLNFINDDVLYLHPVEVKGYIIAGGQTVSKSYSITGLYCNVEHYGGDIVLKINSSKVNIICENTSLN